jgi:hypothetical protein
VDVGVILEEEEVELDFGLHVGCQMNYFIDLLYLGRY